MDRSSTARRWLWLHAPPIGVAVALFVLSAEPKLPDTPGGDKIAHFTAYSVLGLTVARALYHGRAWALGLVVGASIALTALYGLSDELHQSFVPGRDASLGDALADAIGGVFGTLAFVTFARGRRLTR